MRSRIVVAIVSTATIAVLTFMSNPAIAGPKPKPTPIPTPTTTTTPVRSGNVVLSVTNNQVCAVTVFNDTYGAVNVQKDGVFVASLPSSQSMRIPANIDFNTGEVIDTTVTAGGRSLIVTTGCMTVA